MIQDRSNVLTRTNKTRSHCMLAGVLGFFLASSAPVSADFEIEIIKPPDALFANGFGVNNQGVVIGIAQDDMGNYTYAYNMKSGEYSRVDDEPIYLIGINNAGVMVGAQLPGPGNACVIRDKKGNYSQFTPPNMPSTSSCRARGINSRGQITGFYFEPGGEWVGYFYDPKKDVFEEFLPSLETISHEISDNGTIVGSVFLDAEEAYAGSAPGRYGFVRDKDGNVKYAEVVQSFQGRSRLRGITESGRIAGWYAVPVDFGLERKGFSTDMSDDTDFEMIDLDDDQVIFEKPCDPNIPPPPDASYELITDVTVERIRNDGVLVGTCSDTYVSFTPFDLIEYQSGFIATPE